MSNMGVIYDAGMNNGDDSRYYLDKGFHVVGIDANPDLCRSCERRFRDEIQQGQMVILNTGIGLKTETLDFYIHKKESQISTFAPRDLDTGHWDGVPVSIQPLSSIIQRYGAPFFIKIDVEHYDHLVLKDLYDHNIRPPYISAEAHTLDVYCALVFMGYEHFKLVQGKSVPDIYGNHRITRADKTTTWHRFAPYSSGPFGEDVLGPWINKNDLLGSLLEKGLGWIDIHARA